MKINTIKLFAFLVLLPLSALANKAREEVDRAVRQMLCSEIASSYRDEIQFKLLRENAHEQVIEVRFPIELEKHLYMTCSIVPRAGNYHSLSYTIYYKAGDMKPELIRGITWGAMGYKWGCIPMGFNFDECPISQITKEALGVWHCRVEKCIQGHHCCFSCPCTRCTYEDYMPQLRKKKKV